MAKSKKSSSISNKERRRRQLQSMLTEMMSIKQKTTQDIELIQEIRSEIHRLRYPHS